MSATFVKFCGCTHPQDVEDAAAAGADAVGLIFAPSPRQVGMRAAGEIARALPPTVKPVGVFANPTYDDLARFGDLFDDHYVQLVGDESPSFVASLGSRAIKAIAVNAGGEAAGAIAQRGGRYAAALLLFDTKSPIALGGTGRAFDWRSVAAVARERRIIVAGGLTPQNVGSCVRMLRPFGVDVRSGIETAGRKDQARMRAFVGAVREADAG